MELNIDEFQAVVRLYEQHLASCEELVAVPDSRWEGDYPYISVIEKGGVEIKITGSFFNNRLNGNGFLFQLNINGVSIYLCDLRRKALGLVLSKELKIRREEELKDLTIKNEAKIDAAFKAFGIR